MAAAGTQKLQWLPVESDLQPQKVVRSSMPLAVRQRLCLAKLGSDQEAATQLGR